MRPPRFRTLSSVTVAVVNAFWKRVDTVVGADRPSVLAVRAARAKTIVRAYFLYLLMESYGQVLATTNAWVKERPVDARLDLALTSWIPVDAWREIAMGSAFLLLAASMLAATIPRWRAPRIMAVVSFLLLEAMRFDEAEKISHASHPVVWIGIAFCFLPSLRIDSSDRRREYLASFFGAQVFVCLLYFCAGFSKIIGIVFDWPHGVTWLDSEALPLLLAAKWRETTYYPTAELFLTNSWASWVSNVGVLYLEMGALVAVFRPRLHRPWALGLLIMHAMILLTMRIEFPRSALMVGLILLASPFAPTRLELRKTVADLPIVRLTRQWLNARRDAAVDGTPRRGLGRDAPWVPSSTVVKLWLPTLVVAYLCIAYATLDENGRSDQELYPISAMPMFMRIDSSDENVEALAGIREGIEKARAGEPEDDARQETGR